MSGPDQPDEATEDELFLAAMAGVDQLPDRERVPRKPDPQRPTVIAPRPSLTVEGREGRARQVSDRQFADLLAGRIKMSRRLDLHGLRADAARHAVSRDVKRTSEARERGLLVIHGHGTGVLAETAVQTLCGADCSRYVLAFCPAQPRDGGTGALYVLIKRG